MAEEKVIPVKVALRCRPLIQKEIGEGCQTCLEFMSGSTQVIVGKDKFFTYDYVFGPDTLQEEVYQLTVAPLVKNVFKGYNATVLAYGQTGSGKTFSMGTAHNITMFEAEYQMGIIPRVIQSLFEGVSEREDTEFLIKVSFLEIHNEEIHDLLNPSTKKEGINVREDTTGGIKISGLQEVVVRSLEETAKCLEQGSSCRTTGATAMNNYSSRSHAIFTIHLEAIKKSDDQDNRCRAKFHLVDLAGSERAKKTQAQGDRFKEGVNINRGLLALGNVISALGDDNGRKGHIPYRDSKLTRLLQDSLGGNSHTVMIACVSPADSNLEETVNTLRYADRARKIKNKPIINRDPQAAEMARLKEQVQQLQMQLLQSNLQEVANDCTNVLENGFDYGTLLRHNKELKEENSKLCLELQSAIDQTATLCEKVIVAEMLKEKFHKRLEELTQQMNLSISIMNNSNSNNPETNSQQLIEQLDVVKNLQSMIVELEVEDAQLSSCDQQDSKEKLDIDGDSPQSEQDYTFMQVQLGRELQELNKALALKEELASKMAKSYDHMTAIKCEYETNLRELETEVSSLQKEKDELLQTLRNVQQNASSNKISEQRRKRLQELEQQMIQLRKKMVEQSKLLKMKERSDEMVKKLHQEILSMKQTRVKLIRQMREESSRFQKWKQDKDREVMRLKQQDRKRQYALVKLEQIHEKQQQVFRRKIEEASAANKRLKNALQLQKSNSGHKPEQVDQSMSGIGSRIRNWLTQEIEFLVSTEEAKRHLENMMQDRKTLTEQLVILKDKIEDGPPTKKIAWDDENQPGKNDKLQMLKKMKALETDIELRNAQVSDLQQKILDADQDEKAKHRWESIQNMLEAKLALKSLFQTIVTAKVDIGYNKSEITEIKSNFEDCLKTIDDLQEEMTLLKMNHQSEITNMQRENEDKVLYLLRQIQNSSRVSNNSLSENLPENVLEQLKFQATEIERLSELHENLTKKTEECENLKKELNLLKYLGKKTSLMPSITSPNGTPITTLTIKNRRRTKGAQQSRMEFSLSDSYISDDDDENSIVDNSDPDWIRTPLFKKSRSSAAPKRISEDNVCKCKSFCSNKLCRCKKAINKCTDNCKCDTSRCRNREDSSVSNNSDQSQENIMNATFNINDSKINPESSITFQRRRPFSIINHSTNDNETISNSSEGSKLSSPQINIIGTGKRRLLNINSSFFDPIE